ncbi:arginine deiminase-related protein [Balneolales bacterium ANBcel1]|nr:arginine deiminase-related protein [Balneolales bacterium ANBcel1]
MATILTSSGQVQSVLKSAPDIPVPKELLMVTPDHFSVEYIINPHMSGNIGTVDKEKARWEWEVVRDKFRNLGLLIHELPGQPGLPDMVFSANQSLPILDNNGRKHVLMSIMHSEQRQEEVPYIEQWYRRKGYEVHYLNPDRVSDFEGMGDAIWHFRKRVLWGGFGYRSSPAAYEQISAEFDIPVVMLELKHPSFYHLDTCFCILNSDTVLIYPPAFTAEGLELIHAGFSNILEAPAREAEELFACNATCPDGRNVIIQKGCKEVNQQLKKQRFAFHEVDTTEFLKSGGSVFCMKIMLW